MAKADRRAKDAAMAAMMAKNPGQFPDSAVRPWRGEGAGLRSMQVGVARLTGKKYDFGMLGGLLCARLGMGNYGIPPELLK